MEGGVLSHGWSSNLGGTAQSQGGAPRWEVELRVRGGALVRKVELRVREWGSESGVKL